ncbi:hypothetical protein SAMN02745823_03525 [Sporobacter termitidis DSM 10068]|uniref:Uncharacterized protein n=1 Tax=Sporobacter termitidis DSM 10068 TaxID=1123282 RepID=A0A1M5ZD84_9FIRM|nr:hypothetical protein [Sporobacter termitidis]SHI21963.1 hypothetical protein SAMN02745823_03525 [Sporobacter termitidis DSM 10068]
MTKYIIRVIVPGGVVYEYSVKTQRLAELEVERVKKDGYRHYEGNAVIEYRWVHEVTWFRREE